MILMTKGHNELKKLLASLVGSANIFETSIPIVYYPVFLRSGINCLLAELPNDLF